MRRRSHRPVPLGPHAHDGVPVRHRLAAWQRRLLDGSGAVVLVTGAAWLALHYSRGTDALPSAAEATLMQVHGLAAFAGLFVLGVLAAAHVPRGWRLALRHGWVGQRRTGAALCIGAAALVLSGYLLYYFAPETVRPLLGWLHAGIGVAMGGLLLVHRRGRSRSATAHP
jgi:mannose/fructose/N-acetylgalactosamine-specific phosphotransferase system component IID